MTLPAPNLDDRTFQDLVDEAKRMVQRRWPEWTGWTDHNVSDPGVTLIETFAYMVEQLIFRLNRVPDKNYVKFLELIGIELRPPHAADRRRDVLAHGAPAASRRAAAGIRGRHRAHRHQRRHRVPHQRAARHRPVPSGGGRVGARPEAPPRTRPTPWPSAGRSPCSPTSRHRATRSTSGCRTRRRRAWWPFGSPATSRATASIRSTRRGCGRRGRRRDGSECEIERDDTGGFNRAGDVILHVPRRHTESTIAGRPGGWLRCVDLRAGRGPADVPGHAPGTGPGGVHHRWHHHGRPLRRDHQRDARRVRGCARRSGSTSSTGPSPSGPSPS